MPSFCHLLLTYTPLEIACYNGTLPWSWLSPVQNNKKHSFYTVQHWRCYNRTNASIAAVALPLKCCVDRLHRHVDINYTSLTPVISTKLFLNEITVFTHQKTFKLLLIIWNTSIDELLHEIKHSWQKSSNYIIVTCVCI